MSRPIEPIRLGFMPLIDAAIPIVAADKGFAALEGLDLQLMRETSWANIRDRIAIGHFEAAHLLAPMPLAANLGLTPFEAPLVTPMALGPGANAITVSRALYEAMRAAAPDLQVNDPVSVGAALKAVVQARAGKALQFAVVHPHSAQNYVLRYWLSACGITPDRDVEIGVLPPPLMPDALASGAVDGFCVGEPWNSRAAHQGAGAIVLTKVAIWRGGPEKVLGFRRAFAEAKPQVLQAALRAMKAAAQWCRQPEHHEELIDILSRANRLNISAKDIGAALTGTMPLADGRQIAIDPFGDEAALRPDIGAADWFFAQMVRWGQVTDTADNCAAATSAFRPDLLPGAIAAEAATASGFFDQA
ncbi:MAG: ABC transporter substrate-binding protein [Proteobacteria bacterium]|nr:ABC transporter substrate-binding protein [Pseudomonadota bacterium]